MKRILVLDDLKPRHDGFARLFPDWDFTNCYTHDSAVGQMLVGERFDALFLDHDLAEGKAKEFANYVAGFNDQKRRYLNGQDFCLTLRTLMGKFDTEKTLPSRILIHSWNAWGAEQMEALLKPVFSPAWLRILNWPFPAPAEIDQDYQALPTDDAQRVVDFKAKILKLMEV